MKLGKGEFVGREALKRFKRDPGQTRIGLELAGKRIARQGCVVRHEGKEVGVVTSGTFAPTLGKSLAMALVDPLFQTIGAALEVVVRDQAEPRGSCRCRFITENANTRFCPFHPQRDLNRCSSRAT